MHAHCDLGLQGVYRAALQIAGAARRLDDKRRALLTAEENASERAESADKAAQARADLTAEVEAFAADEGLDGDTVGWVNNYYVGERPGLFLAGAHPGAKVRKLGIKRP